MKTNILSLVIVTLMAGMMATSCVATAKRNVKSANGNSKQTHEKLNLEQKDLKEEIRATAKIDWEKFKEESETEIEKRNIQIAKLRREISEIDEDSQQRLTIELDRLEHKKDTLKERLAQRNEQFKANLAQFDESSRLVAKEFEKELVNDMNELMASLKNLFKNKVE